MNSGHHLRAGTVSCLLQIPVLDGVFLATAWEVGLSSRLSLAGPILLVLLP